MAWAISGLISHDPIEGGIEISDAKYAQALDAMLGGKEIVVTDGGLSIVDPAPPAPSPAERRGACFAAIRAALSAQNDAVLSPARRQLALIDEARIRRKPIEERSQAENLRLADIERDQLRFEGLEHHAALLAVEVEDLAEGELATWTPHSWPE